MAGSEDHKTYIWDLQTREIVQVLEGHTGTSVSQIARTDPSLLSMTDIVVAVAVSFSVPSSTSFYMLMSMSRPILLRT